MAPTKNRMRPIAAAVPIQWHADADEQSDRASCLKDAKRSYPRFRHACLGHVNEDLLIADEVECGREDVSRSSQESDNDVGDEHGELQ
jgi:hypothetical protein